MIRKHVSAHLLSHVPKSKCLLSCSGGGRSSAVYYWCGRGGRGHRHRRTLGVGHRNVGSGGGDRSAGGSGGSRGGVRHLKWGELCCEFEGRLAEVHDAVVVDAERHLGGRRGGGGHRRRVRWRLGVGRSGRRRRTSAIYTCGGRGRLLLLREVVRPERTPLQVVEVGGGRERRQRRELAAERRERLLREVLRERQQVAGQRHQELMRHLSVRVREVCEA